MEYWRDGLTTFPINTSILNHSIYSGFFFRFPERPWRVLMHSGEIRNHSPIA